jgi:hypothetical protein
MVAYLQNATRAKSKLNAGDGAPVTANFGWSKMCGRILETASDLCSPQNRIFDMEGNKSNRTEVHCV